MYEYYFRNRRAQFLTPQTIEDNVAPSMLDAETITAHQRSVCFLFRQTRAAFHRAEILIHAIESSVIGITYSLRTSRDLLRPLHLR
jgi:hypothetical protein